MAGPPVRHKRCCSACPQGSPSTRGSHPLGSGESPRSGSQMTGLLPGMVRSKVSSGYSVSTLRPLDISSLRISISPSNLTHMLLQADLHSTAGLFAWSTTPAPPLSFYSFSRSTIFTMHLLRARHHSQCWGCSSEQDHTKIPALVELTF